MFIHFPWQMMYISSWNILKIFIYLKILLKNKNKNLDFNTWQTKEKFYKQIENCIYLVGKCLFYKCFQTKMVFYLTCKFTKLCSSKKSQNISRHSLFLFIKYAAVKMITFSWKNILVFSYHLLPLFLKISFSI